MTYGTALGATATDEGSLFLTRDTGLSVVVRADGRGHVAGGFRTGAFRTSHMSQDERGGAVSPRNVSEQNVLSINSESESLDAVFRALADHRRRCACHYLTRSDGPIQVRELAALVAASMSEKSRAVLTTEEIEKTRTELLQIHLPKLAEAGIVDYDGDSVKFTASSEVQACLSAASPVDLG